jgi:hypothetical protein
VGVAAELLPLLRRTLDARSSLALAINSAGATVLALLVAAAAPAVLLDRMLRLAGRRVALPHAAGCVPRIISGGNCTS